MAELPTLVRPERSAKRGVEGLLALALVACSPEAPPTAIDGSSPQAFEQSAAQAREDIPVADRLDFDRALATVGGRRFSAEAERLRRTTFSGMTAAEIVADYRRRQRL